MKYLALLTILALQAPSSAPATLDPFAFFRPTALVSAEDRRRLDRGESIAHVLPAINREVALFGAVPVNIDGDRLAAWIHQIADLKRSAHVPAIGRFSTPPRIGDLGGLALDEDDLSQLRRCRPRACGLKLTVADIAQLPGVLAGAGPDWKPALQAWFRGLVLRRVETYLAKGQAGLEDYGDQTHPASPAASFSLLLKHSVFLSEGLPQLVHYLDRFPRDPPADVASFVYWSKERLGGKPIVRATHVLMTRGVGRGLPDVVVVGRDVFSTHYLDGSLGVTALVGDAGRSRRYLVYLNRSDVDVLGGAFGGVVRWVMERRLNAEASDILQGLSRRLEGGDPVLR